MFLHGSDSIAPQGLSAEQADNQPKAHQARREANRPPSEILHNFDVHPRQVVDMTAAF